MPKSMFQEKDYLNHRYFYKRAFYLASITASIKHAAPEDCRVAFSCLNGNQLQPIIVVRSGKDGAGNESSRPKCRVHILLSCPQDTFTEGKLLPEACCLRSRASDDSTPDPQLNSTPFYNASVRLDCTISAYSQLLQFSSKNCEAFLDACILGRIWLRQRGFGSQIGKGGFGHFEWAAIIALLLQPNTSATKPTLSPRYSSYQLFKATLQFFASRDLTKSPYFFRASNVSSPAIEPVPMFFDGPRGINLLFKMTPWSYTRLQQEAQVAVQMLGDTVVDHFVSAFITKVDSLYCRYDAHVQIPLASLGLANDQYYESRVHRSRKIANTLERALTDRIRTLSLRLPDEEGWEVHASRPGEDSKGVILISLATDPASVNRTVDHGPAAEQKHEAARFRKFWGDKAELRRFKDGSILESVVWSLQDDTASVLEQIIRFIVRRHLGATVVTGLRFFRDPFDHVLAQPDTTSFFPLMNAFSVLETVIRKLEGMPLHTRSVLASDAQLRYASINLPVATPQRFMALPADVIVQFEGSARWPDDLCAIQRTKMAFLLKIADLLAAAHSQYTTRLGLENPSESSQNQGYLDIFSPSGHAFRLRIHHDREAALLGSQVKDKSLTGPSREAAGAALSAYKRDFVHRTAHTQMVQKLCIRFAALSPSIRLLKQWFAAHLLAPHFSPELIELLVLRTFLQPYPWPVPACSRTGFLRTLGWISRWDWRRVPLIVDFSSHDIQAAAASAVNAGSSFKTREGLTREVQMRFDAWRHIDPSLNRVVLFAATNIDTEGNTWSDKAMPERVVAARMTTLAKAAVEVVNAEETRVLSAVNGTETAHAKRNAQSRLASETLFHSPLQDYDFVLHMAPRLAKAMPRSRSKHQRMQQELLHSTAPDMQAVGYDPVASFTAELRDIYGDAVLWFWNPTARAVIAGLWNPAATAERAWKVRAGWNSKPVQRRSAAGARPAGSAAEAQTATAADRTRIRINKTAILNEIARLGGDMIERIEVIKGM